MAAVHPMAPAVTAMVAQTPVETVDSAQRSSVASGAAASAAACPTARARLTAWGESLAPPMAPGRRMASALPMATAWTAVSSTAWVRRTARVCLALPQLVPGGSDMQTGKATVAVAVATAAGSALAAAVAGTSRRAAAPCRGRAVAPDARPSLAVASASAGQRRGSPPYPPAGGQPRHLCYCRRRRRPLRRHRRTRAMREPAVAPVLVATPPPPPLRLLLPLLLPLLQPPPPPTHRDGGCMPYAGRTGAGGAPGERRRPPVP